jgi:hypothetical protein
LPEATRRLFTTLNKRSGHTPGLCRSSGSELGKWEPDRKRTAGPGRINADAREGFRQTDYTAQIAMAQINGCGVNGYVLALEQIAYLLERQQASQDQQKTS